MSIYLGTNLLSSSSIDNSNIIDLINNSSTTDVINSSRLPDISITDVETFASTALRNASTNTWHKGDIAVITGDPVSSYIFVGTDGDSDGTVDGDWQILNTPTAIPIATQSVIGGVKIGYNENGKNYPLELDVDMEAFVNVPWTDTQNTIDDTPQDGVTTNSISSNWAFDNVKTAVPASAHFGTQALGTAAYTATGDYATSAQGTTADNAIPEPTLPNDTAASVVTLSTDNAGAVTRGTALVSSFEPADSAIVKLDESGQTFTETVTFAAGQTFPGAGGGVSGSAGFFPIFDSSTDGVGDSAMSQQENTGSGEVVSGVRIGSTTGQEYSGFAVLSNNNGQTAIHIPINNLALSDSGQAFVVVPGDSTVYGPFSYRTWRNGDTDGGLFNGDESFFTGSGAYTGDFVRFRIEPSDSQRTAVMAALTAAADTTTLTLGGNNNVNLGFHTGTGEGAFAIELFGDINVDTNLTTSGDLEVAGATQLSGNTNAGGNLTVAGATTLNTGLTGYLRADAGVVSMAADPSGGVSGTAGFIPVFDASADGVDNSVLSQGQVTITRDTTGTPTNPFGTLISIPMAAGTVIPAGYTITAGGLTFALAVELGADAGNIEIFADNATDVATFISGIGTGVQTLSFLSATIVGLSGDLSVSGNTTLNGPLTIDGGFSDDITVNNSTNLVAPNGFQIQGGSSASSVVNAGTGGVSITTGGSNSISISSSNTLSINSGGNQNILLTASTGNGQIRVNSSGVTHGTSSSPNILSVQDNGQVVTTSPISQELPGNVSVVYDADRGTGTVGVAYIDLSLSGTFLSSAVDLTVGAAFDTISFSFDGEVSRDTAATALGIPDTGTALAEPITFSFTTTDGDSLSITAAALSGNSDSGWSIPTGGTSGTGTLAIGEAVNVSAGSSSVTINGDLTVTGDINDRISFSVGDPTFEPTGTSLSGTLSSTAHPSGFDFSSFIDGTNVSIDGAGDFSASFTANDRIRMSDGTNSVDVLFDSGLNNALIIDQIPGVDYSSAPTFSAGATVTVTLLEEVAGVNETTVTGGLTVTEGITRTGTGSTTTEGVKFWSGTMNDYTNLGTSRDQNTIYYVTDA